MGTSSATTGEPVRRPRSAATRAAILAAARSHFAEEGYDRTTIRGVAASAGVDPAMVMRYYGNKDGLFAAASDYDLHLPDLTATPVRRLGQATVSAFLDRWEPAGEIDGTLLILLRTTLTQDSARETMREIFAGQVGPVVARVSPGPEAPVRAGLIAAHLLGLALTRYVLRLPPIAGLARDELVGWIGPAVQRYLTGPVPTALPH